MNMKRSILLIGAVAISLGFFTGTARALNTDWTGATGSWHIGTNWDNGVPTSSDYAYIRNGGTAEITETADSYFTYLGDGISGRVHHTAGTHTITWILHAGYGGDSYGQYDLHGTAQLVDDGVVLGQDGCGQFNHYGGTHNVDNNLYLGYNSDGTGTYVMDAGELTTTNTIVGRYGDGEFEQWSGTHTIVGDLHLSNFSTSYGRYDLGGGDLYANYEYIGNGGATAEFYQSGGTNDCNVGITIGDGMFSDSLYDISGGSLITGHLIVSGTGTFQVANNSACIEISGVAVTSVCGLTFEEGAQYYAVEGTTIHMTGSNFHNEQTCSSDLSGLGNTTFIFEGGEYDLDTFEVAGADMGAVEEGFIDNFVLDELILGGADIGQIQLVDEFNNSGGVEGDGFTDEALYVNSLILNQDSILDLNGYHLYTRYFEDNGGTVLNGDVTVIPEPATLALFIPALLGIAGVARRKLS